MYSAPVMLYKYFKYYVTASNGKGHGVHSPFVFDFIQRILNDDRSFYAFEWIESVRNNLKSDKRLITIDDFGAGSRVAKTKQRTIQQIAASSLKPKKYSQLLFRMIDYYQPQTILELGTSLGITTAYLANANKHAQIITLEGAKEVAAIARQNFDALHLTNVSLIEGNFDETLLQVIGDKMPKVDFAFIDGNHRLEPTLKYLASLLPALHENSCVVFDDIHWSAEMEEAWQQIQQHPNVTLTIDLFFIGVVFFRKEQKVKQHFAIRF